MLNLNRWPQFLCSMILSSLASKTLIERIWNFTEKSIMIWLLDDSHCFTRESSYRCQKILKLGRRVYFWSEIVQKWLSVLLLFKCVLMEWPLGNSSFHWFSILYIVFLTCFVPLMIIIIKKKLIIYVALAKVEYCTLSLYVAY